MRAVLDALADISDTALDRPVPDGGWTAREIAHHLAESETNGFARLRRLIAEDGPLIVPYDQDEYARHNHYDRPIGASLAVLDAVRASSMELLEALTPAEWERSGQHTDSGRYSVDDWLGVYARHPHEHAGQIRRARGWERQLEVPGGSLFIQQEGVGVSLVLLHAGIVDARAWDALVPLLTSTGHRVIRYDRRGFGRSLTQDVAYSNRADMLAVLDALEVERAVIVGNSQGGQIAVDTAIEFPERVAGVVTIGASLGGYEPDITPEETALFEEMDRLQDARDVSAIVTLDLSVWVDGQGQGPDRVPAHVREAVAAMDRGIWEPTRIEGQPVPLEPRAAERLSELAAPVLAIAGTLDVSDVWMTAQYLAANAPDARAVLLPNVAHMIAMETPEEIARLVAGFVAALPMPRAGR